MQRFRERMESKPSGLASGVVSLRRRSLGLVAQTRTTAAEAKRSAAAAGLKRFRRLPLVPKSLEMPGGDGIDSKASRRKNADVTMTG